MKIFKKILIILIIVLIAYFIIFQVLGLKTNIMKKVYPQKYKDYISMYAEEYNVDPLLIFAIIKTESNFNTNSKSSKEAKGLMQLMENTANELFTEESEDLDLYNPEINIKLGTYYFSKLLEKYDYQIGIALAAYNAGMGNVNSWIEKRIIQANGSDLENIPYKETNMYVRKVLNNYIIYKELYDY